MQFPNNLCSMDIGERVREARTKQKWSQEELARRAGVTQGLISQIENGINDGSKYLTTIARVLEVSPDWLESGRGEIKRRESNVPLSLHYPPMIEDTLAVIPDPDGAGIFLVVFKDVNGTQVTLKLQDTAAGTLGKKLAEQGK